MSPFCVRYGWVWQIFSYMFVHGTLSHLLLNMFPLYIFGRVLEREIGSREFLLYYFLCGVLGGVINFLYYYFTGNYGIMILGSSGCVYALLFLTAVFFPNARLLFFFFIPVRMPVAVLFYIVIELMYQITGMGAGVAHLIHLSCIAIGWVYCLVRFKMNPLDMWRRNL
ncbi:MAG: rhomboid family intramembrane serine protease [Sphaerochaetaceae bacterium]|nr:rhomboid family intramembrane serine protease [Sphaerochaetaceae bacterium]